MDFFRGVFVDFSWTFLRGLFCVDFFAWTFRGLFDPWTFRGLFGISVALLNNLVW